MFAFPQFAASSATRILTRQRQNPKPLQTLPPSPLTGRLGPRLGSLAHHNSHRHKQLCVLRGALDYILFQRQRGESDTAFQECLGLSGRHKASDQESLLRTPRAST